MSYQLSFKASKCTLGSSSAKSVLRCLCDYADDDGTNCRPSTDTISLETEFDRRTVFKAIAFLSSNDWIRVYKNGRGSRNFYALNVQKISNGFEQSRILKEGFYNESSSNFVTSDKNDTSIKNATRSSIKNDTTSSYINDTSNKFDTSDKNDTEVGTFLHFHSDKNDTQLSQYSVNTQSDIYTNEKNDSLKNSEPVDDELPLVEVSEVVETAPASSKPKKSKTNVTKPDDVSDDLWADFLAHRKQKKAIVSERVINTIRNEAKIAGWTLEEALDEVILRDWRGFKAEWVKDEWKDPNAKWITADDFYKDLEPVTYSDEAKAVLGEYVKKGMRAYNVSDIPDVPKETNK